VEQPPEAVKLPSYGASASYRQMKLDASPSDPSAADLRLAAVVFFWRCLLRPHERIFWKIPSLVEMKLRKTAQSRRIRAKNMRFSTKNTRFSRLHLAGCGRGARA
jgi:hypothetical protein